MQPTDSELISIIEDKIKKASKQSSDLYWEALEKRDINYFVSQAEVQGYLNFLKDMKMALENPHWRGGTYLKVAVEVLKETL